ncbi:Ig-like domain-containing protein [Undibacterium sp. Ren11W]|uniref:Ig-like domain-containing protein n=1 Tax=Undibacterium sp. Ren11W TaxID=3413045 RepID=UPI003BF36E71
MADDASVSWNKPSSIPVLQNDSASRGSLTLSAVGAPAHGSAKLLGNAIEYTPNAGYFGPDTLSYTAEGEGGVQASASVNIKVSADIKISGVVSDGPIANAQLSVTLGAQTVNTVAAADGSYSLTLKLDKPEDMISIVATGVGAQSKVKLQSLIGDAATLAKLANNQGEVSAAATSSLNVSHLSTASAMLAIQGNGKQMPKSQLELNSAVSSLHIEDQIEIATAIKLIVDKGVALPAGIADTLVFASNPVYSSQLYSFVEDQKITNNALFNETYGEVLRAISTDVRPVFAPTKTLSLVYLNGKTSETDGMAVDYQPDGNASVHTVYGSRPATWSLDAGRLNIKLSTPYLIDDFDSSTHDRTVFEVDAFSFVLVAGRADSGTVNIYRSGKITLLEGPNVGKVTVFDSGANGTFNKVMDRAKSTPLSAADFSVGSKWAGIESNLNLFDSGLIKETDIFEVTGSNSGRMLRGGLSVTWSFSIDTLTLAGGTKVVRFSRLIRDEKSGTEIWLMNDGEKINLKTVAKVEPNRRFVRDGSFYRQWQVNTNSALISSVFSDGKGIDNSQGPTIWVLDDQGVLTQTEQFNTDYPVKRVWYLLSVKENFYTVMEHRYILASGYSQWFVKVIKDVGPASK